MGYTITEKILLAHTEGKSIRPADFVWAKVDFCLGNDITAPLAIQEFLKLERPNVFDPAKIALIPDHFIPARDMQAAARARELKDFADKFKIKHYYEVGCMGIEHALVPELGLISPGDLIIGADSHTCTYGALGAFSTGVGSTDLAACFATGRAWFRVPQTLKFIYRGKLGRWLSGKDIILYTIADIGVDGATYQAMEFSGPVIEGLGMDDRFTICNMAIEAGAKSGIIAPDEITFEYIKEVTKSPPRLRSPQCRAPQLQALRREAGQVGHKVTSKKIWDKLRSDNDAEYVDIREYDVSKWQPAVACPHLPGNVRPVSKVKNVKLNQVVIGSCTNGRISDLRMAAKVLKGKKIKAGLRLIVIPATQKIYLQALNEGLAEIFVKAGGVFSTPTCGPCLGGHLGILDDGEIALATTNRNFLGRMGSPQSFVYLSNPAVAAASAIKGHICHPNEVL